jgi:hypothetical protein
MVKSILSLKYVLRDFEPSRIEFRAQLGRALQQLREFFFATIRG